MAQQDNQGGGTQVLTIIAVALVAFLGGYFVGGKAKPAGTDTAVAAVEGEAAPGAAARGGAEIAGNDSPQIPVGDSATKGKADAVVTIVEFSDFQCPYCSRGGKTALDVVKKFPNDVRVVFKHNPLPFHKEAPAASKAALAAGEQGKFWEMHDILFENQKGMKNADMAAWTAGFAQQLGLDVAKYKTDFANPKWDAVIKRDMEVGSKIGVRGTPHFFINGERLSGAQPIAKFEEVVKRQLELAKKELAAGTARPDLYKKLVAQNYKAAPAPPQKGAPQATVVNMIPIRPDDPIKGERKNFLITIAEFSDFQCPFCTRVNPTIAEIMKNYGKDVRIIFKQNPLPFHKQAPQAAYASLAANEQGKFWEMHDFLFQNQAAMKNADMDSLMKEYAQKLGLNAAKFEAAYKSDKIRNMVKEDQALAGKVGARGTPNFFVNGVQVVGAKPFAAFDTIIKQQLTIAKKLQKEKKLSGEALYEAAVAHNKANAPKAAPTPAAPAAKVDLKDLKIGNSATKGNKNAKVTIFEFSDFQCPYCKRGNDSVQQALKTYGDKVQVVFKAYPLPFHKEAEPAHRSALAAKNQGKFWEMHDKYFANAAALKTPGIHEQYAKELGLNMAKWKKDFDDPKTAAAVKAEMAEGSKVGVRGTPAFFINGNRLVGAQPFDKFKALIDAELKK